MKACDLGAKDGDYIVRSNEAPFAYRVFGGDGLIIVWGDEDCRLQDLPHSNWQLLQPRPELGEPVSAKDLRPRGRYLVLDPNDGLCEARIDQTTGQVNYLDPLGFLMNAGHGRYKVYRDPRPLPALPKREPTLREKIDSVFEKHRAATVEDSDLRADLCSIPEIAAILENHDE